MNPTSYISCAPFSPIAAFGLRLDISDSDNYYETIPLPFEFPWPGNGTYSEVIITTNGQVFLGSRVPSDMSHGAPIEAGGLISEALIAVGSTDFNPASDSSTGAIYVAWSEASFVISYEGIAHFVHDELTSPEDILDCQVALFADGRVEMRWGKGRLPQGAQGVLFVAGIEDDQVDLIAPAMGFPFGEGGFGGGVASSWPRNQCRAYVPVGDTFLQGGYEQP